MACNIVYLIVQILESLQKTIEEVNKVGHFVSVLNVENTIIRPKLSQKRVKLGIPNANIKRALGDDELSRVRYEDIRENTGVEYTKIML